MEQVIVYENENGSLSICYPTGELSIQEVLVKDCPNNAFIIDSTSLPQGDDDKFFDAWRLVNNNIVVDIDVAKQFQQNNLNLIAKSEAQHRMTNTLSGIDNKISDTDWLSLLSNTRITISSATNTTDLINALIPVQNAIDDNK